MSHANLRACQSCSKVFAHGKNSTSWSSPTTCLAKGTFLVNINSLTCVFPSFNPSYWTIHIPKCINYLLVLSHVSLIKIYLYVQLFNKNMLNLMHGEKEWYVWFLFVPIHIHECVYYNSKLFYYIITNLW